jgi:hypothetical protein
MQTLTQGDGGLCFHCGGGGGGCVLTLKKNCPIGITPWLRVLLFFMCASLFVCGTKNEWKMNGRRAAVAADSLGGEHVLILSAGAFNGSESRFAATLLTLIAKMENFPPAARIPTGVCLISLLTLMPAEN